VSPALGDAGFIERHIFIGQLARRGEAVGDEDRAAFQPRFNVAQNAPRASPA